MQTAVTANVADFDEFQVQSQVHIAITVKDFKAIVTHSDTLHCQFKTYFSHPGKPLQFSYEAFGIECTFTLMTINDGRSVPAPVLANTHQMSTRTSKKVETASEAASGISRSRNKAGDMPPPPLPPPHPHGRRPLGRAKPTQTTPVSQAPGLESDSLFIQQEDDDERWAPNDFEQDDALGWDASANTVGVFVYTLLLQADSCRRVSTPPSGTPAQRALLGTIP